MEPTTIFLYVFALLFWINLIFCNPCIDYSAEAKILLDLENIKNPTNGEKSLAKKLVYERLAHKKTNDDKVAVQKDKDAFEAKFSDCSWTMCLRQVIEVYEDEFKKLELFIDCDEYGNLTAGHPKFKLNKAAVREILDYFDRQAEVRRQKWTFYGNNPPTSLFDSLIQRVKAGNMSVEDFAAGIAQAFKMLSLLFHQGFFKGAKMAFSVNLHMFETVNQALNIILANVNFAPSLFSYDNKTSCRPQVCDVGKQNFLNSTLLNIDTKVH